MLWNYALKYFAEQINELKEDGDGVTIIDNFLGTTIDTTLKNNHTWECPVFVLDARLQGKIGGSHYC